MIALLQQCQMCKNLKQVVNFFKFNSKFIKHVSITWCYLLRAKVKRVPFWGLGFLSKMEILK